MKSTKPPIGAPLNTFVLGCKHTEMAVLERDWRLFAHTAGQEKVYVASAYYAQYLAFPKTGDVLSDHLKMVDVADTDLLDRWPKPWMEEA